MSYKFLFKATFVILVLFVITFILIPLCCGYTVGFLEGLQVSLENIYFVSSIFVAIIVAVFTYKIYNRQLKLQEKQTSISEAQVKISEKQTEIMAQQNQIALFEKRHEIYLLIIRIRELRVLLGDISTLSLADAYIQEGSIETYKYAIVSCLNLGENSIDDITIGTLKIREDLERIPFIFMSKSIYFPCKNIIESLIAFMLECLNSSDINKVDSKIDSFIAEYDKQMPDIFEKIEKEMNL